MTAPSAEAGDLLYRVACPCAWMGNRRKPTARACPWCGGPGKQIRTWWQVGRAHQSVVYILHFHWPKGVVRDPDNLDWLVWPDGRRIRFQADHYSGSTCDLPRRLAEHLSGRGAKLVAAALELGANVRVSRVWHVPVAFEQRLRRPKPTLSPQSTNGQRFGSIQLRPLCPEPGCAGDKAWARLAETKVRGYYRQLRQAFQATRQARRDWDAHCAELKAAGIWDADKAWDEAFPQLAYDSPADQATHPSNGNADQAAATATSCGSSQHTWLDPADAAKCCNPLWTKNLVIYSLDDRPQPGDCPVRDLPGMAWRWELAAHVEDRPPELDLTADIPID
jgi:hypothetical protein